MLDGSEICRLSKMDRVFDGERHATIVSCTDSLDGIERLPNTINYYIMYFSRRHTEQHSRPDFTDNTLFRSDPNFQLKALKAYATSRFCNPITDNISLALAFRDRGQERKNIRLPGGSENASKLR